MIFGTGWASFGTELPHVTGQGLEINYPVNKIRIGTYGRGVWEHDLMCVYDNAPIEITGIQEWNTDSRISNDIIIKQNAVLTIKSKISMVSEAKIVVETGGKLILDGGTLTKGCTGQHNGYLYKSWCRTTESRVLPD